MNKKDKRIIAELKEYVKNGYAKFSNDTYAYSCQRGWLTKNDIQSVIEEMKETIRKTEQNNKLVHRKKFDIWKFVQISDKLVYANYCDKRTMRPYYYYISEKCYLPVDFLIAFQNKLNWDKAFQNKLIKVTDNLDYLFGNVTDTEFWMYLPQFFELDEEFIELHADKLIWQYVFEWQMLSEEFIEKHADKVEWYFIFRYQRLSNEFIIKHVMHLKYFLWLKCNKQLTEEQKQELKEKYNIDMVIEMRDVV